MNSEASISQKVKGFEKSSDLNEPDSGEKNSPLQTGSYSDRPVARIASIAAKYKSFNLNRYWNRTVVAAVRSGSSGETQEQIVTRMYVLL